MTYSFLILSLLFLIPGLVIFFSRPDLRPVIGLMALCSIPFAFTEFLFYPSYWEPRFLFDLADRIGFGLEDLLFVIGLGAFTSTAYAFFTGSRYERLGEPSRRRLWLRAVALFGVVFTLVSGIALAGIAMIYGSVIVMLGVSVFLCARRRDLTVPTLWGGALTAVVYSGLCFVFMLLIPDVFHLTWHTEEFLDIFILGIPLEEILYAWGAGAVATAFYPYVFCRRFRAGPSRSPRIVPRP